MTDRAAPHSAKLRHQLGETEESVQRAIIQALTLKGYDVRQTTVRLRRCRQCGASATGKYGASKAIADLLVWVAGAWRMLEVKGPLTPLSPEQKQAVAEGKMRVARSIDDALEAVRAWELG